jgi:hypothetical protein
MVQRRDMSQVVSYAQGGGDPRWLGEIGHVAGLKYSFAYPGGPDQMSCVLQIPPTQREVGMNPGRPVSIFRGSGQIWNGLMNEPQPAVDGWSLSAVGSGGLGNNFCDIYTNWNQPDNHINAAIGRGLNWLNPGIDGTSGLWLGDQVDSGSEMITDFLNSITVQGALSWNVDARDNRLTVAPLPATVNRLLVATSPVARTVAGDINSLWLYYQISGDSSDDASTATYGLVNVTNAADIAAHGTTEDYYDLTSNGDMTEAEVKANGNAVLARYNRASFAGPFTCAPGELLTSGGYPVDLGCERAGNVYRLMLSSFGYGGEVVPGPVTFVGGAVEYDDAAQTLTVTPFQNVANSFSDLLAAVFPPVATVS